MIRWITPRLGTAPATSTEIDGDVARVDVRDLVDKFGNSPEAVREKIEQGVALVAEGRRVVVCCDYGISRSNAIAAGILTRSENIPLSQALRMVVEATGEKEIKLEPLNAVKAALFGGAGQRPLGTRPRVLITGGSGFLGRHLGAALADRADLVLAPGRELDLGSGALALELMVQEGGIDQIVHLANPRVYTSNRAMGDTLSMLRNVLDVCRSAGTRLVFLSSWEVYSGYRAERILADETLPLRPKGPYGETKLLCERLLAHHREMHALDCAIIRSSPVYGEGSDKPKFIYNFVRQALEDAEIIRTHLYLNGPPMLDLMHESDLIRLVADLVIERPAGDFNAGGGRLYGTQEIAELIVAHCGARSRIEHTSVADHVANVLMDSSRARTLLGWRATRRLEDDLPELMANLGTTNG